MDGYRACISLAVPLGLLALCGSSCAWVRPKPPLYSPPPAFSAQPTLQDVIQTVNRNSTQIRSFSTNQATLSGQGFPTLRASVVFERPRRLRILAETGFTGPELDVGSNDGLFWVWVRRNEPKAIYFCRHGDFATSPVRETFPLDPDWFVEALGITELDPALPHEGPFALSGGRYQIRTIRNSPEGPTTKLTVVDDRGRVSEQHVYDARGQRVASAYTREHRRDPATGLTLPKVVEINCPKAEFSIRIDLGPVEVNRAGGERPELFAMPRYEGFPAVNLCDPRLRLQPALRPTLNPDRTAAQPRVRVRR